MDPRVVGWRRDDEVSGHSLGRLSSADDGWVAHGHEVLLGDVPLACWFRVELDTGWRTRRAEVRVLTAEREASLVLEADADGAWRVDGAAASHLDGCVDVDVAASPLTNTFPIRRLERLEPGAAETLDVAWVDVPSLGVRRVAQTYRRLGERRWEYRDPVHGAFTLSVDADGLVEHYEGFARRIVP